MSVNPWIAAATESHSSETPHVPPGREAAKNLRPRCRRWGLNPRAAITSGSRKFDFHSACPLDRPNISPPRSLVHFGLKNEVPAKFWTGQEDVRPANRRDFGPLRVFAIRRDWPVNGSAGILRNTACGLYTCIDRMAHSSGIRIVQNSPKNS